MRKKPPAAVHMMKPEGLADHRQVVERSETPVRQYNKSKP